MTPANIPLAMANRILLATIIIAITIQISHAREDQTDANQLRKSIVFDLKTPKVFYCPQEKFADSDQMIVKARPLDKLCEFDGAAKPRGAISDCYNDIDETEIACDEKKRFMIRLDLAGELDALTSQGDVKLLGLDQNYHAIMEEPSSTKKKLSPNGKKY